MKNPWIQAMGFGLVGLAAMLAITALAAKLIEGGALPMTAVPFAAYAIIALGSLTGGLCTALSAKRLCLPLTLLTGGVELLALCILNGALQRGEFQRLLPTAGVVIGVSLLCALLAAGRKGKNYI